MFTDSSAIDYFLNDMILVKVNAEVDSNLAKSMSISGYPTLVLVDKDGVEVDRIVGYMPTEDFLQTLNDYQNDIGTLADLLRRSDTSQDRSLYGEIANKYKYSGKADDAMSWFKKIIEAGDPTDSLSGNARMSIADTYRRADDYEQALTKYQNIEKDFTGTGIGMDAVIYQAIVYRSMADTTKAVDTFKAYVERFPDSEDVEYATKQIEKLTNPAPAGK